MRVQLYGRYGEFPKELEDAVGKIGLEIVNENPEVIITYGGDGTLLGAERDYPGIPKLPLKNSDHCHLCYAVPNEKLLELLISNQLISMKYFKLEAIIGNKKIIALNDIIIAHKFPNNAIRFILEPKTQSQDPYVGDGLIIATPFGSTGYFYSVTKTTFTNGLGIAFNNIHNADIREKIVGEGEEIKIILTRGPAVLASDNDPNLIELKEDEEITLRKAERFATLLSPLSQLIENPSNGPSQPDGDPLSSLSSVASG